MPPTPPPPKRAKKSVKEDLAYFLQKGDKLRRAGQYQEAVQVLNRALLLEKSARALAARASARRALLQREAAVEDYSTAFKVDAQATYISSRGVVKSELGWYRDALEDFNTALAMDSRDKVAIWGLKWVKHLESHAPLRILLLNGFQSMSAMNTTYVERRIPECIILGRETYWSLDNQHVLYYSSQERRWKGCRAIDVPRISKTVSPGCIGGPERHHLLSQSLPSGWFEWDGQAWNKIPTAGVRSFGPITAPLRIVSLHDFWRKMINTSYVERRQLAFMVNSRETYWSMDGSQFIYWCPKESRWRGCRAQDLLKVQQGESVALFGAPRSADILSFKTGWHELQNKEWVTSTAGIRVEQQSLRKRTVTLAGFTVEGVNGVYKENRQKELMVSDREIYLSPKPLPDGGHFLYWSKAESRWKGTVFSNLQRIQEGRQSAIIAAPQLADLFDPALVRGWHEWSGKGWVYRAAAGVCAMGMLREEHAAKAPKEIDNQKKRKREEPGQSREQLIQGVFKHFDKNGDKLLDAIEMLGFASSVGFDGSREEWKEEYRLICEGLGRKPQQGIDAAAFFRLVNEDTDDGCYCSDKELAAMLGQTWPGVS